MIQAGSRDRSKSKAKEASVARSVSTVECDEEDMARLKLELLSYCHQCRNKNRYEKMRCTKIKEGGHPCGLLFCHKCVLLRCVSSTFMIAHRVMISLVYRYPSIEFNEYATYFACPKCLDTCNCTACCGRRGEKYVSSRGKKITQELRILRAFTLLPSAQEVLRKATTAPVRARGPSRKRRMVQRLESVSEFDERDFLTGSPQSDVVPLLTLQDGAAWGTIYDINGRKRVGRGEYVDGRVKVVAESDVQGQGSSSGMKKKNQGQGKRKPSQRKFIGVPQAGWRVVEEQEGMGAVPDGAHAFVGAKHTLFAWRRDLSFNVGQDQGSTSPPSEGPGQEGSDDTVPTVPQEARQFLLAELLNRGQSSIVP